MNDLYLEIWTRPGDADFDRVVEDPDALTFGATVRMGLGEGQMAVPAMWEYLNDCLFDDPADPSNNVRTLARIYNEKRPEIPVAEWFLDDLTPNDDDSGVWDVKGLGIAKIFGYMIVEPPDWDGSADFVAAVPDWIYGGKNIAGDLVGRYTPERVEINVVNADDGTFTITVINDLGSDTTAALAYDASALDVDIALTALANVTFVDVSKSGTTYRITFEDSSSNYIVSTNSSGLDGQWEVAVNATAGTFTVTVNGNASGNIAYNASAAAVKAAIEAITGITTVNVTKLVSSTPYHRWQVEFVTPDSASTFTINDGGLTGSGTVTHLVATAQVGTEEQGGIRPAGWEISQSYLSNLQHGPVFEFRMWETGDPALPAGCDSAFMFNGGEEWFPGVQRVMNVIPGALYQVHAWVTALNAGDTVRMVVRTEAEQELNDNARDEQTIAVSGVWQEFSIADLRIPDDVSRIIFRFGHVDEDGVDPGRIFVACPTFRLGFAPDTWGAILEDLYVAATTGVPSRTNAGYGLWWDERDGTGVDRYLELDFDGTNDSNGDPWIRVEELTIKRGLNGLQVLDQGADLGYEHRVIPKQLKTGDPNDDGVWLLQAFNPGGMDDGHPADEEFLISAAERVGLQFFAPRGTRVIAEGSDNRSSRAISAAAEGTLGAIEVYLNQRDLQSEDTISAAAAAGLADVIRRTKSVNLVLHPLPDEHQPLVDWLLPGNTEDVELPPLLPRESHRIQEITLAVADSGVEYQIAMGAQAPGAGFTAVSKAVNYLLTRPDVIRDDGETVVQVDGLPPVPRGAGTIPFLVAASNSPQEMKDVAAYICDGVDDQVQIQAALWAAFDTNFGQTVWLAQGEYNVTTQPGGIGLTVPDYVSLKAWAGVSEVSDGFAPAWIYESSAGDPANSVLIDVWRSSGLDGIGVYAYGTNQIAVRMDDGCAIRDCYIESDYIGVQTKGVHWTIQDTLVSIFGTDQGPCIDINEGGDDDWHVRHCTLFGGTQGIRMSDSLPGIGGRWWIVDNWILGSGYEGIRIPAGSGWQYGYTQIRGNLIQGVGREGVGEYAAIFVEGTNAGIEPDLESSADEGHMLIVDNIIEDVNGGPDGGNGIWVKDAQFVIVARNMIENSTFHGIKLDGTSAVQVVGNSVSWPAVVADFDGVHLTGDGYDNVVMDNQVIGSDDGGTPRIWRYGVNIATAGMNGTIVVGNDLRRLGTGSTAPINDSGTGTILSYPGHATYGDNFT